MLRRYLWIDRHCVNSPSLQWRNKPHLGHFRLIHRNCLWLRQTSFYSVAICAHQTLLFNSLQFLRVGAEMDFLGLHRRPKVKAVCCSSRTAGLKQFRRCLPASFFHQEAYFLMENFTRLLLWFQLLVLKIFFFIDHGIPWTNVTSQTQSSPCFCYFSCCLEFKSAC